MHFQVGTALVNAGLERIRKDASLAPILTRMPKGSITVLKGSGDPFPGDVLEEPHAEDSSTRGIIAFNEHIKQQQDVDKIMVTVRDGMTLIVV